MHATTPVFEAAEITKVYRMGEVEVHALRGVDLELWPRASSWCCSAPPARASRPCSTCWAASTLPPRAVVRWRDHDLAAADDAAAHRVPARPRRLRLPVLQPGAEPDGARERGAGRRDRAEPHDPPRRPWRWSGSPTGSTTSRPSSPAASSSAWPSPGPSPSGPTCCSATSRPAPSTPPPGGWCWRRSTGVNRELGTTTVVITHNAAIAAMADRVIRMRRRADRAEIERNARRASPGGAVLVSALEPQAPPRPLARPRPGARHRRGRGLRRGDLVGVDGHVRARWRAAATLYYAPEALRRRLRRGGARAGAGGAPDGGAPRRRRGGDPRGRRRRGPTCPTASARLRLVSLDAVRRPAEPAPPAPGTAPRPTRAGRRWSRRASRPRTGIVPGDRLLLTVNGRREPLLVTGVALSPEYVYAIPPGGSLPDDRALRHRLDAAAALEAALDMEGAFDAVALRLAPGASDGDGRRRRRPACSRRYGGLGAYGRDRQVSHRFVTDEIRSSGPWPGAPGHLPRRGGLPRLGLPLPAGLGPARPDRHAQGARLRRTAPSPSTTPASPWWWPPWGSSLGAGLGHLFGVWMSRMYRDFYRFPVLDYRADLGTMAAAFALALGAAAGRRGRSGPRRPSASPPPRPCGRPPRRRSAAPSSSGSGLAALLSLPARMALRNLGRRPVRALLGTLGIASAVAVLVTGSFFDRRGGLHGDRGLRAGAARRRHRRLHRPRIAGGDRRARPRPRRARRGALSRRARHRPQRPPERAACADRLPPGAPALPGRGPGRARPADPGGGADDLEAPRRAPPRLPRRSAARRAARRPPAHGRGGRGRYRGRPARPLRRRLARGAVAPGG